MHCVVQPLSDSELLARIRADDMAAFELLFRAYVKRLCGFAYRFVGNAELAEELVQDVFLTLWSRRMEWHPQGTVRSYLFVAVRNRALHALERRRSETSYQETWQASYDSAVAETLPDRQLADSELDAIVQRAIQSLPERARLVFTLHREQEMSYAEIATVLAISVKTVESQMGRALKLLRERLNAVRPE